MNITPINNINFTSVIPVNVYINNQISTDKKHIQKACQEAVKMISGPVNKHPEYLEFIKDFGVKDAEFSPRRAWYGYCIKGKTAYGDVINETPSNYFKIIFDKKGNGYITTGDESVELSKLGKRIGIEKLKCNERGLKSSYELEYVLSTYGECIQRLTDNSKRRLTESSQIIKDTRGNNIIKRTGKPVELDIFVKTNGVNSKSGNLKITLDNLSFNTKK